MSLGLRIALLLAAAMAAVFIIYRIRRSKVRLQDTIFWIVTVVILAVMGLFPSVSFWAARTLGIQSPANFVYLMMIALLFEKLLTLSILNSQNEEKYVELAAELALRCKDLERRIDELEEKISKENEQNEA
ncbi:MAG: DUF2304 domain-containing protein [Lachnospiraceae bacterium]|nr:DUF2304 domain-containing protein [Lachnospiraceae bacterium]